MIARGKWGGGEVEEGKGIAMVLKGDLTLSTQYNIQMMCYRIVYLKPYIILLTYITPIKI